MCLFMFRGREREREREIPIIYREGANTTKLEGGREREREL